MVDIVAVLSPSFNTVATIQENGLTTVQSATYNPNIVNSISDVGDVDTSTLINGSVLVYKTTTNRWTSTTTLDAQDMEGGEF